MGLSIQTIPNEEYMETNYVNGIENGDYKFYGKYMNGE